MSTSGEGSTGPDVAESKARRPGRVPAVVQAVMVLALCAGAIFWAWRVMWDNGHPVQAAARGLGARAHRIGWPRSASSRGWDSA